MQINQDLRKTDYSCINKFLKQLILRTIETTRQNRGSVFDVPKARSRRAKLGPTFLPSRRTLPLLAFGSRSIDQPAGAIPLPGSVCSFIKNSLYFIRYDLSEISVQYLIESNLYTIHHGTLQKRENNIRENRIILIFSNTQYLNKK